MSFKSNKLIRKIKLLYFISPNFCLQFCPSPPLSFSSMKHLYSTPKLMSLLNLLVTFSSCLRKRQNVHVLIKSLSKYRLYKKCLLILG